MGKFNAATAVESLEFDFTAFGGGSGTIPEPTTRQITDFNVVIAEISKQLRDTQVAINKQANETAEKSDLELIESMDEAAAEAMSIKMNKSIEDLSSGVITGAMLEKLPYRVQSAFMGWIAGELNPESQAAATKR